MDDMTVYGGREDGDMSSETFELQELDDAFWRKVIFIDVCHSSGLGGPGAIQIFTEDNKKYFIGLEELPYNEVHLEGFHPWFGRKRNENGEYLLEAEHHGFKAFLGGVDELLVKEEYYDRFKEEYFAAREEERLTPSTIMEKVLSPHGKMQSFCLKETYQAAKREEKERGKREKERKRKELTKEDFDWRPIYNNNYDEGFPEEGYYCLLLRKEKNGIYGTRYSIGYQREEIEPLGHKQGTPIELYVVFEKDYGKIKGSLDFNDPKGFRIYTPKEYANLGTLNDFDLNDFGRFVKALPTMEEAKNYAMAVANIRSRVNKDNIVIPDYNKTAKDFFKETCDLPELKYGKGPFFLLVTADEWNHDADEWLGIYTGRKEAGEAYDRAVVWWNEEQSRSKYPTPQRVAMYEYIAEKDRFREVDRKELD